MKYSLLENLKTNREKYSNCGRDYRLYSEVLNLIAWLNVLSSFKLGLVRDESSG